MTTGSCIASNSPETPRDAKVHSELVALLYECSGRNAVTAWLVALAPAALVQPLVSSTSIILWLVLSVLPVVARLVLVARFRKAAPGPKDVDQWARRLVIVTTVSGLFYGISGFITITCVPPDPAITTVVVSIFAAYVAVGIRALGASTAACYCALMLPLQLVPVGLMLRGQSVDYVLAVLMFVYFLLSIQHAKDMYRTVSQSIVLRFENAEKHQQAEQAREAAEQANTAKSKFLAAASHDLRQPLHAMTFLHFALSKHVVGAKAEAVMNSMKMSLDALHGLFNTLLDISRLDAGVISPQIRDFKLQELIKRLRNDFAPEAQAKGLQFRCETEDPSVRSDPQLLERILRNFLSNAMRYTERGEVALRTDVKDDVVCIRVSDTGKGIPREKHEEIFREFHQLENPERDRSKGLGLGLAIVDRLARLLNHPLGVESEPGRGSVFRISVPIGEAADIPSIDTLVPDVVDLSGLLVLVVDDEHDVCLSTATLLEDWGCECTLAGSEDEAVEQLRRIKRIPDAVIADYRLREERTGAQAIRRIHQECGIAMPALIITGDTAPDRLREATESGYQLLHKPAPPEQLYLFLRDVGMQRLRGGVADTA